jgi:hypothetical protein
MNHFSKETDPEMLDEYDFSNGVRGKYVDRFTKGAKVMLLDPDVPDASDSESVTQALREPADATRDQDQKEQP